MPQTNADALWLPFTNTRAFRKAPRLFVGAKDMHYRTPDGRAVLDGTSGLWCVNAGHCREPIVQAIARQAGEMDFGPTFQLSHPLAQALAAKVAALMPAGIDKVFFTNSGSESVETALKIAIAYWRAKGEGQRTRLIGRERAYHGVNFGGISVGGIPNNRRIWPSLPGVDHLPVPFDPKRRFQRGQPADGADKADALEAIVQLHGPETIAAVIVEPMQGSTGVIVPPAGYLERLREITSQHGILLIFDEVITGFGRLGAATAAERMGVRPDLITLAKGLTNGAVPMGAVAVDGAIHDAVVNGAPDGIELYHGYTYSGHPLAAAAGVATLDLYAEEGLFERARRLEPIWQDAVHGLADARHVIDVRDFGLTAGIELAARDGAVGARGYEAFNRAYDTGLLTRVTGDTLAFSPPLIVGEAQIGEIVEKLRAVLAEVG